MNKTHKKRIQKWVDALRSGKYRQTNSCLKNQKNSYCCLGVACDVYEKQTKKKLSTKQWNLGLLPLEVADWLGFDSLESQLDPIVTDTELSATDVNDGRKWSFKKIANAIEKTYLGVNHEQNTQKKNSKVGRCA